MTEQMFNVDGAEFRFLRDLSPAPPALRRGFLVGLRQVAAFVRVERRLGKSLMFRSHFLLIACTAH